VVYILEIDNCITERDLTDFIRNYGTLFDLLLGVFSASVVLLLAQMLTVSPQGDSMGKAANRVPVTDRQVLRYTGCRSNKHGWLWLSLLEEDVLQTQHSWICNACYRRCKAAPTTLLHSACMLCAVIESMYIHS
jgi:hypothetical protein